MNTFTKIAALVLVTSCASAPVMAQQQCVARAEAVKTLIETWKEYGQGAGITLAGELMEIWVSEEGVWSLTVTTANGITCMVIAGDGYTVLAETAPPNL